MLIAEHLLNLDGGVIILHPECGCLSCHGRLTLAWDSLRWTWLGADARLRPLGWDLYRVVGYHSVWSNSCRTVYNRQTGLQGVITS